MQQIVRRSRDGTGHHYALKRGSLITEPVFLFTTQQLHTSCLCFYYAVIINFHIPESTVKDSIGFAGFTTYPARDLTVSVTMKYQCWRYEIRFAFTLVRKMKPGALNVPMQTFVKCFWLSPTICLFTSFSPNCPDSLNLLIAIMLRYFSFLELWVP